MSTATTLPIGDSAESDDGQKKGPKPTKVLPTNRVALPKQWDILRAFGALSGAENKTVPNSDVSKVVNLHHATVGLITPFFVDIGLLKRSGDGMTPVAEVCDFARSYEWDPDKAFHRLAPALQKAWFFTTIKSKLSYGPLAMDAAIQELSLAANAGPAYRGQLAALLQYMRQAAIITVDGDQIKLQRSGRTDELIEARKEAGPQQAIQEGPKPSNMNSNFSSMQNGAVQFTVNVHVDMAEFATWQPTRISAFFAGIAQVLAAKGAIEEKSARQ